MANEKIITVESEIRRLKKILKPLPKAKMAVAEGLIVQAARHRVQLNEIYSDIEANGRTEPFQQSEKCEPYDRERPCVSQYIKLDKNYQTIMKTLAEMAPDQAKKSKLLEMMQE